MEYLWRCLLIFGILIAWTTKGEARLFEYCARALTKPEPLLIKTEQQMRDEGYEEEFIAGLDHTRSNLQLAHQLRTGSIDPTATHIEEFANLIDTHIAFIERGIRSQNYNFPGFTDDKALRLEQLERLKSEAQMQKDLEEVAYEWWFLFNLRLSIIATPWVSLWTRLAFKDKQPLNLMTNSEIQNYWKSKFYQSLLYNLPERILIPTIQDLSKTAINETYGTGVHLIGLVNDKLFDMWPARFFEHDLEYAIIDRRIDQSQTAKRVMQKKANLPRHQREPVEILFFDRTNEYGNAVGSIYRYLSSKEDRDIPLTEPEQILLKIIKDSYWESFLSYIFPWLRI